MISGNRLGSEKSPYLLQHASNPVWWHPWGDEAFALAEREGKPVFLSIGYATCYWCHVMEKDSFEHDEVARVLNEHFISIKLDREERPDIDAIYMDAVVGMTGHGGWPMSVFMTAQRAPFWGGTFFYRAQFLQILERLNHLWRSDRETVLASVDQITQFLRRKTHVASLALASEKEFEAQIIEALHQNFDQHYGGFGSKPKFPPTSQISLLARITGDGYGNATHFMHDLTLDCMAKGGLFDHVGGGFARYSTDQRWLIPHFEKMLYDNALLAVSYGEGWQQREKPEWLEIMRSTLDFMLRELHTAQGAFASALDAGEVGKEGEFYVWSEREVKELLSPEEFKATSEAFPITAEGNFEAKHTVLAIDLDKPLSARSDALVAGALSKLFAAREKRQRPFLDDKVLTGWNGLAISAFALGYRLMRDERYKTAAETAAQFLLSTMRGDNTLLRRYRDGEARFDGCLEDYAYFVAGLIDLGVACGEPRWLKEARSIQNLQDVNLWEGSAYLSSRSADLLVQKREFADGALPSPNAIAFFNLHRLEVLFSEFSFGERAKKLTQTFLVEAQKYPQEFCRFFAARESLKKHQEIVTIVPEGAEVSSEIDLAVRTHFRPGRMVLIVDEKRIGDLPMLEGKKSVDGKLTAYLCDAGGCRPPRHDILDLLTEP